MGFNRSGLLLLTGLTVLYFGVYTFVEGRFVQTSADAANTPATVMIDAGHGGEDGGAVSLSQIKESDINLSVAKKLEQLLSFCGVHTKMVRQDGQALSTQGDTIRERKISDLKNRVAMINGTDGAVLVSIHQNHFPQEKYRGPQVFYADTPGSKSLGELMQKALYEAAESPQKRGIKKAESVYLLNNIRCTAVLVECGFLSNPQEELLLQSSDYQKKLVCAISDAVMEHLHEENMDDEI